jgi:hypothetical protein
MVSSVPWIRRTDCLFGRMGAMKHQKGCDDERDWLCDQGTPRRFAQVRSSAFTRFRFSAASDRVTAELRTQGEPKARSSERAGQKIRFRPLPLASARFETAGVFLLPRCVSENDEKSLDSRLFPAIPAYSSLFPDNLFLFGRARVAYCVLREESETRTTHHAIRFGPVKPGQTNQLSQLVSWKTSIKLLL